jgi:DNA-binding IscR family transcriptional regulator
MKKDRIKVGGTYQARVSGRIVRVRVEAIRTVERPTGYSLRNATRTTTLYDVLNLVTKRRLTFRSAAKFRCEELRQEKALKDAQQQLDALQQQTDLEYASIPEELRNL